MLRIQVNNRLLRYAHIVLLLLFVTILLLPAPAMAATAGMQQPSGYTQDDDWEYKCSSRHYVHHGDTLSRIAAYYGVDLYSLAQMNGIYDVNRIYPGQQLCIPTGYPHGKQPGDRERDDDTYRHNTDCDDDYGKHCDDYTSDRHCGHDGYGKGCDKGSAYGKGQHDQDYRYDLYDDEDYDRDDSGYYQTNGGHTGVCYYPDPRYAPKRAHYYEEDEQPNC